MHCLVVTISYRVDNHITSFVAILLLLAMVYNELYYIICAIHACYVYQIVYHIVLNVLHIYVNMKILYCEITYH